MNRRTFLETFIAPILFHPTRPVIEQNNHHYLNAVAYGLAEQNTPHVNTAAINAALRDLAARKKSTVYIPPGTYAIETDIYIGQMINLMDGQTLWLSAGAVLASQTRTGASNTHSHPAILITGNNCEIYGGGKITGTLEANHYGIIINENTSNNSVHDIYIEQFGGDAIVSYGNNASIKNLRIAEAGRNGITIANGRYITVEQCAVEKIGAIGEPGAGIICEPDPDHAISEVVIQGNRINQTKRGIYVQAGHTSTENVRVSNNLIENSEVFAINMYRIKKGRVAGNETRGENQQVLVGECTDLLVNHTW